MISDQSETNSECLLLEHAETLVRLLNRFGKKTNVSSQRVLDKLVYLYFRLSDFLAQEEDVEGNKCKREVPLTKSYMQESTVDPKSHVENPSYQISPQLIPHTKQDYDILLVQHIQKAGEKHDDISKIKHEKQDIDVNQGIKRKDSAAMKNIPEVTLSTIQCGICKELIPIVDSNFTLAMALHVEEPIHQSAIALEKTVQEVMNLSTMQTERQAAADLDPYISYQDISGFSCELCKKCMTGIENTREHIAGSGHRNKLDAQAMDTDITVLENGIYFCNLCSAPLGNSSNAIYHKKGKNHRRKYIARQNMGLENLMRQVVVTEERVWLKIPSGARIHRIYFENVGESSVFCKLCSTNVPKTEVNILSHIYGKLHSRAFDKK